MSTHLRIGAAHGTAEWYDQRRGMVTASVVGRLITPTLKIAANDYSRALTADLVAERITGYSEPTYMNGDMWRGIDDEPRAIGDYSDHYAFVTASGFMVREVNGCTCEGRTDPWPGHADSCPQVKRFEIGYSPDGLVGDDGLIEVKSRRQKKQLQTVLSDAVPAENMAQLQAGLLVSGREWIDYVSYCGGMSLYVKRVLPDPDWFEAITEAVALFEQVADEMVAAYNQATSGLPISARFVEPEMSL